MDQLKCIFEYLGSPPDEIVQRIAKGRARKYIRSLPIYRKKPFNFAKGGDQGVLCYSSVPHRPLLTSFTALDLLSSLLLYEPSSRLTAAQALEHPYLSSFYDPEDEYFLPQPTVFDRWREIESLETVEEFRDAIWKEIQVRDPFIWPFFHFGLTRARVQALITFEFVIIFTNIPDDRTTAPKHALLLRSPPPFRR